MLFMETNLFFFFYNKHFPVFFFFFFFLSGGGPSVGERRDCAEDDAVLAFTLLLTLVKLTNFF